MPTMPLPDIERLKVLKARLDPHLEAAGTRLRPLVARAEREIARGVDYLAPHATRLNSRLRGVPAIASAQDRAQATWDRLVEAFCQTIEPLLASRFPEERLVAVADAAGQLTLHRAGRDGAAELGAMDALEPDALAVLAATRWSAVELRLPATQVLERKLALPAASRDFLGPILEHRLDRLTPWRADKVLYGYRVAEDDAGAGSVAPPL